MMTNNHNTQHTGYTSFAKILHWLVAAIWISAWCIAFAGVHWRKQVNADFHLTNLHKAIASTVLVLTVVRVLWRITHRPPSLPSTMSSLMQRAAGAAHIAIYLVALIALPMTGWYWSSVSNHPVMMLGFISIPPLVAVDPSMYQIAKWIHTCTAWSCGGLIALHILAALKHRFVDKDDVLAQMLPRLK